MGKPTTPQIFRIQEETRDESLATLKADFFCTEVLSPSSVRTGFLSTFSFHVYHLLEQILFYFLRTSKSSIQRHVIKININDYYLQQITHLTNSKRRWDPIVTLIQIMVLLLMYYWYLLIIHFLNGRRIARESIESVSASLILSWLKPFYFL